MPESSPNYGIQQSGGVSNVGNQAVGENARAISHGQHFTAAPATNELVTELMTLLQRHREELPDAVDEVAEELQDELDSPEPDRGVIARTLERLNNMVRPVAPLVETVGELTKAVDSAFGS
ncbi:hypothetical protein SAMN04488564_102381 [Lentzea waywayandensis]|uniref:Uncharacterized protein n=1 Tax=Lentzea waywayandensis TaxID=84724 RepID=A0A1I6DE69_9PSEU|nr:hypothetical protein [Lentzea waywayandensis]SFR03743.1 hypothetical protein SAMN04488564_102381 [Lentzea waywayandensis]